MVLEICEKFCQALDKVSDSFVCDVSQVSIQVWSLFAPLFLEVPFSSLEPQIGAIAVDIEKKGNNPPHRFLCLVFENTLRVCLFK